MTSNSIEFRCGQTIGPFPAIRRANKPNGVGITMDDFTGEKCHFELLKPLDLLGRLEQCISPLFANCILMQNGDTLQLMMTRDVKTDEKLEAILIAQKIPNIKKFACSKCHIAKFSSIQNLKVHEELYCNLRDMEVSSTEGMMMRKQNNLIFLPLAFHDLPQPNIMKPLGPAQSVIPIAIGKPPNGTFSTNPFLINTSEKIPEKIDIKIADFTISVPIINLDEKTSIDLASKVAEFEPTTSSSSSSSPKSRTSDPEKPFACTCGVSFSNERTFEAHRNFYCKNSSANSGGKNENTCRKVPDKCVQCDFKPLSASHLSMHVRTAHQTSNIFTCMVCKYRAFSMRGIRTHMRSHPSENSQRFQITQGTCKKV